MSNIVDTRGLSCPQPVIAVLAEIKRLGKGEITVLADTDTTKENVGRASLSKGWSVVDTQVTDYGFKIVIRNNE